MGPGWLQCLASVKGITIFLRAPFRGLKVVQC